jgi:uncharacterized protein YegL
MLTRRLAVYLLIDTSGSMHGEPIESVNIGLRTLVSSLRQNGYARKSIHICIVTFDSVVKEVLPLTPLDTLQLPEITCPKSGGTFLGEGLEVIFKKVQNEFIKSSADNEGDWKPVLLIMSDGKASDTLAYEEAIPKIKSLPFSNIIACAAGPKSVPDQLKELTPTVVSLDTMDSSTFSTFFKWVGDAVASGNGDTQDPSSQLPSPPPQITVVF